MISSLSFKKDSTYTLAQLLENKDKIKCIASVSFGKDSLAMLLRLIKEGWPLDEVVFYDTGVEFNAIYRIRDKIKALLLEKNITYTELKPKCEFFYKMFNLVVNKGKPSEHKGYSWCGGRCRWGTTEKLKALEKYCKGAIEYVGIAADEPARLSKERKGNKVFPLAECKMSETDCLKYCYDEGYNWLEQQTNDYPERKVELYSILDRVSCWCCGNKNILELYNIYLYLPDYWSMLRYLQSRTERPFKKGYTIEDLNKRFYAHWNGDKEWKYLHKAKKPNKEAV